MMCAGRLVILSCVCVLGVLTATVSSQNAQRTRTRTAPAKPQVKTPESPNRFPILSGLFNGQRDDFPHSDDACDDVFNYPIDLPVDASIARYGQLNFTGFQYAYQTILTHVEDYFELTLKHDKEVFVSQAGLNGKYFLDKIRILAPSPHTVAGVSYSVEIQYIFVNNRYTSYDVASTHPDGLAVVSVFVVIGVDPHPAFQEILDTISLLSEDSPNSTLQHPFSPQSLLPEELCTFFRYRGKFSNVECEGIATWTLFTDTIQITKEQLAELLDYLDDETNENKEDLKFRSIPLVDFSDVLPKRRRIVTIQPIMFCKTPILDRSGFPWYLFHRS